MYTSVGKPSSSAVTARLHSSRRRSITVSAATLILGTATLALLSMLQYYRTISSRDPTSCFFDSSRAYEKRHSDQRTQQVQTYLKEIEGKPESTIIKHVGPPTLCVGINTASRQDDQYVGLTVGSLLIGLSFESRWPIFLNVLIGHTNPPEYPDWQAAWLQKLPDQVLTYDQVGADISKIHEWQSGGWHHNKTMYDYSLLLQNCYDTGAHYVLMLEDDVLAVDGWYEATMDALDRVEKSMQARLSQRWLYLRLFYTEDLLGWHGEEWVAYLFWSLLVWACTTIGMLMFWKRSQLVQRNCSFATVLVLSLIFVPAAIGLHFMAGRHSTWPLSAGIHEMNKYGCCSQSLVYPRHVIPNLLQWTRLAPNVSLHVMLEHVADQEKWIR